ncbi:hypothetical protein H6P81_011193 [Aristolochia fimbriata]|uniref:Aldose 1-epimerase n=1 Tax=Aristolochia fimbriata TaxID=158543 RepID=A0AAV7ER56_ARIFI|nr:hypothetical protein H6P81_011193 [Aristolochia fimbriata]
MAKAQLLLVLYLSAFALFDVSSATRKHVKLYEIKKGDFSVKITNWGATVVSAILPDSKGNLADVVLGFDSVSPYYNVSTYFGALVGRVANRIGGGKFVLDGKVYQIFQNEGQNTLHGGHRGFSKVIWTASEHRTGGDYPSITFTYHSFDGEQGFPGDVDVSVTYTITGDHELSISMLAKPLNKPTPINLASHTYWNLGGHNSGTILSNTIQIFGSKVTPVDDSLIPTGEIVPVKGTAYDFLKPASIGSRIGQIKPGYDINYVLDASAVDTLGVRKVSVLRDEKSGRQMELWTNMPGVQFYTSNMLKDVVGKGGHVYGEYDGLCLETQGYPDSVNHPNFPAQIVRPGQVYNHYMRYKFSF